MTNTTAAQNKGGKSTEAGSETNTQEAVKLNHNQEHDRYSHAYKYTWAELFYYCDVYVLS